MLFSLLIFRPRSSCILLITVGPLTLMLRSRPSGEGPETPAVLPKSQVHLHACEAEGQSQVAKCMFLLNGSFSACSLVLLES